MGGCRMTFPGWGTPRWVNWVSWFACASIRSEPMATASASLNQYSVFLSFTGSIIERWVLKKMVQVQILQLELPKDSGQVDWSTKEGISKISTKKRKFTHVTRDELIQSLRWGTHEFTPHSRKCATQCQLQLTSNPARNEQIPCAKLCRNELLPEFTPPFR